MKQITDRLNALLADFIAEVNPNEFELEEMDQIISAQSYLIEASEILVKVVGQTEMPVKNYGNAFVVETSIGAGWAPLLCYGVDEEAVSFGVCDDILKNCGRARVVRNGVVVHPIKKSPVGG